MSMNHVYAIWFSWWPFFVFGGLFYGICIAARALYVRCSAVRGRAPSYRSMREICTLNLQELKRQTAEIERLAAALEKHDRA